MVVHKVQSWSWSLQSQRTDGPHQSFRWLMKDVKASETWGLHRAATLLLLPGPTCLKHGKYWHYHDASPHTIPRPHLTKMPVLFIVYYQEAAFSSEICMLFVSISLRFLSSPLWTAQHINTKNCAGLPRVYIPLSFGRLKDLVQRNVWPKNTIYRL